MIWNDHSKLKGSHAILGASKPSWLNYESSKQLADAYIRSWSAPIGTSVHEFADRMIKRKRELSENDINVLDYHLLNSGIPDHIVGAIDLPYIFSNMANYVNDAIKYGMDTEVILYYSNNCYGTADAITVKRKKLRIHDLKTGSQPAHMEQLMIYAALYFMEYKEDPNKFTTELRIYQNNDILICNPKANEIIDITNAIRKGDEIIENVRTGVYEDD